MFRFRCCVFPEREFVLNFGDELTSIKFDNREPKANSRYYTIDGRLMNGVPAQKGIYK